MMIPSTFILNLAPNGVIPTPEMNADVPVTPDQVAKQVKECLSIGISSIHIHARDEKGVNTSDPIIYRKYIEAIRNVSSDIVICVSCSGRLNPSYESRSGVLDLEKDLRPDMASLTLSSLNFTKSASINEPDTIIRLSEKMFEKGIKPELEIFDLGMMNYAHYMIDKEYLKAPYYFNFILGNISSAQTKLLHVGTMLSEMPVESLWTVGGVGLAQLPSSVLALSQNGGVRVGLEDNIWYDQNRTQLATNASLVKRVNDIATLMDKKAMSPFELRKKLGI